MSSMIVWQSVENKIKKKYYQEELDEIESSIRLFEIKREEINVRFHPTPMTAESQTNNDFFDLVDVVREVILSTLTSEIY